MAAFSVLTLRLAYLQIKRQGHYGTLAAQMRQRVQKLAAHRGSIRDVNGEPLAQDEQVHELYVDRTHIKEANVIRKRLAELRQRTVAAIADELTPAAILDAYHEHVATVLTPLVSKSQAEVMVALRSTRPETVLLKNIEDEEVPMWREVLAAQKITGVYLRPSVKRHYPAKDRLTHLLGDVDFDNQGFWGVEALMDEVLTGKPGEQWIERDNKGRELPLYRGKVVEPRDGQDVYLTIDMHLQDHIEHVLEQQCLIYKPAKATIVLMEPKTGSILAMASRPHYERDTKSGMLRNIAIADILEPGSTFKLVTFAAALDKGAVSPHERIFCHNGTYNEPGFRRPLTDDHPLGDITVEDILVQSSNIGAYKMAKRAGVDAFFQYAKGFGFGVKPGTGIKGESAGLLSDANMSNSRLSRMAMGYAVSVTPLQLAMMTCAIANGGAMMKPRVVDRIARHQDGPVQVIEPELLRQVCKPRTADILRDMLVKVVTEGTGKKAAIEGVNVAGKTGTAQRYDEKLRDYAKGHYNASFIGFAPAENPQVACVVVIEDPVAERSELYGGKVSAPIFAEVVKEALDHLATNKRHFRVRLAEKGGAK